VTPIDMSMNSANRQDLQAERTNIAPFPAELTPQLCSSKLNKNMLLGWPWVQSWDQFQLQFYSIGEGVNGVY
jgi:hypothetical protein